MNATDCADAVAVVCENQGDTATSVRVYLDSRNLAPTRWYDPLDLDDLDEAVREGRIRHVVFPRLSTLLTGIWNGRIAFEHWLSGDVRLDFVTPPAATPKLASSPSSTAFAIPRILWLAPDPKAPES